jgi:hypothetical protein
MCSKERPWTILALFLGVLATAHTATAQTPAGDEALDKLPAVHADYLRLNVAGRTLEVPQSEVQPVERRKHDSLLNGVLIGAWVGAALGLIPDYYDDCEECHDSLYMSIAVGAGVGLLIDALTTRRVVPTSAANASKLVNVAVGRRSVGVRATFQWR